MTDFWEQRKRLEAIFLGISGCHVGFRDQRSLGIADGRELIRDGLGLENRCRRFYRLRCGRMTWPRWRRLSWRTTSTQTRNWRRTRWTNPCGLVDMHRAPRCLRCFVGSQNASPRSPHVHAVVCTMYASVPAVTYGTYVWDRTCLAVDSVGWPMPGVVIVHQHFGGPGQGKEWRLGPEVPGHIHQDSGTLREGGLLRGRREACILFLHESSAQADTNAK